jgi:nickel-dependent lactate racemase
MEFVYSFPYSDFEPLKITKGEIVGIFETKKVDVNQDISFLIKDAISHPIASLPLRDLAKKAKRILILSDDNTRATPTSRILPYVLEELQVNEKKDIAILIATGTHRALTPEEIQLKLGEEVVKTYDIYCHKWDSSDELFFMGKTSNLGIDLWVNRLVRSADLIIGIGSIMPHAVAGFSGGGKIVVPGICGEGTCGDMHWAMVSFRSEELLGTIDNPVRRIINEVATEVGLRFIINAILDSDGKVINIVAGDLIEAHRRGSSLSREIHKVIIPRRADLVIMDSYGTDLDYWQAIKAMTPADIVMEDGGVVVHIAECKEGVSPSHPELLEYGYPPVSKVIELVNRGIITKSVGAHMIQASRVLDRGKCILVSKGITAEEAKRLGFEWASTPQEAYERAIEILEKDRNTINIAILRKAGDLLPIIGGK